MAGVIVLDASVVIAFLDSSDSSHERAAEFMEQHAASGFLMHQLTLAEVLVGAVRAGRGNQLFEDLAAIGVGVHEGAPSEALLLAELRASTGLRMPDCCVLLVAQQQGLPLATFDKQLAQVARSLGVGVLG